MCRIISETVFCCSFSDIDSTIVCPPPASKAKRAADYVESKGVLAERYDVMMHFAIAHMRRADGALPPHSSGRKALDFLAPAGEHRCSLFTADYTCQLDSTVCSMSWQRVQVLYPSKSTGLWLLVLLYVGESGWSCSVIESQNLS
jgi:hypothetical protein